MTERGRRHNARSRTDFVIGPSHLRWDGDALIIDINEVGVPIPHRVRGRVVIHPQQLFTFSTPLDAAGRHRWGPLAPRARVTVSLGSPAQQWQGTAYLDSNEGDEPLERAFTEWDWSRSPLADGSTAVIYDVEPGQAHERLLALRFRPDGGIEPFDAPPIHRLPRTAWRLDRRLRSEHAPRVHESLEDTPFYQRATVHHRVLGEDSLAFHETLHVPRLVSPVVQAMLPWRMPRRR